MIPAVPDSTFLRQPWFKFFPSDWQGDELLAMCSLGARGLLAECLCLMHKATPYGYLLVNGKQPSDLELMRLARASSASEVRKYRGELLDRGVLSSDDAGIYSRRMVRKGRQSAIGHETGKEGGNPRLTRRPLTVSDDEPLRVGVNGASNPQKLEARNQNPLPPPGVLCEDDLADRARRFLEAYPGIYARCRAGAFLRIKEARDFPTALELVTDYQPLERLESMLELFLLRKDTGEMGKPGSPRQFQHYAPDCDRLLRENGR